MAEDSNTNDWRKDFRKLRDEWAKGFLNQLDFIKKEKLKIKDELELIPSNELHKKYDFLKRKKIENLREKAEFEFKYHLKLQNSFSFYPDALKQLDEYIDELIAKLEAYMALMDEPAPKQEAELLPINLSELFQNQSQYNFIINLLVEKGFCHPQTKLWQDDKKGNKVMLVAVIKHLHIMGYYKDNKKPSADQIKAIAKNTFGSEISIDTVKKTSPAEVNLNFIPQAINAK